MDIKFEQKVREKAYEIWVAAGMEDGMADQHWVTAERAVMNETQTPTARKAKVATASAKKPAKTAAPKAAAPKVAPKKPAARSAKATKTVKH